MLLLHVSECSEFDINKKLPNELYFHKCSVTRVQTNRSSPFTVHKACLFSKSYMLLWYRAHGNNIDVSQSADDLVYWEALARKHHKNFLLLIMGLVGKLNEASEASLTRRDLPIIPR